MRTTRNTQICTLSAKSPNLLGISLVLITPASIPTPECQGVGHTNRGIDKLFVRNLLPSTTQTNHNASMPLRYKFYQSKTLVYPAHYAQYAHVRLSAKSAGSLTPHAHHCLRYLCTPYQTTMGRQQTTYEKSPAPYQPRQTIIPFTPLPYELVKAKTFAYLRIAHNTRICEYA